MKLPDFKVRASSSSKLLGIKGLGQTGLTYVEEWIKFHLYGYANEFSNKYTEKGNACEEQGIELVSRFYDLGMLMKNTERKYNDFAEGEADIVRAKSIDDIKNSWNCYTFPLFEKECTNPAYIAQGNTYLWIWDKEVFNLHYCLCDAPPKMIDAEYWKMHKNAGIDSDEVDSNLFEEVRSKMIHSHLPDHLRLKTFVIKRDEKLIDKLKERVLECREIIKSYK